MALTKIQLSELLRVYADMLTDKQRVALLMYCDCDCSLSEIASEVGISRQGVRDAIVKGEATLVKLENVLHLAELYSQLTVAVEQQDVDKVFQVAKSFVSKE
ncbi:MAG: hypothetical protein J1G02_03855 [Clostridiales bacterium]|nr:hypothetical protein [Clostridiales bacterium]